MFCKLFWWLIRRTYPWLSLVINLWRITNSTDRQRHRAQVRFWILWSRIDFPSLIAIANELIQPEYWA
ncbi:hypothetical protein CLI64_05775 [Nostoc sp. CENA543]|uniref:hypothetical protein n=1 Tax=Nostoc sp. CENA543 TaxID=1869241 RepID=UPI000CA096AB|nr:hypothetical protein [Nostoc sp. CENA543]AUS99937.1 hypothetical protein CLI64_05775 [Nostoc sp. CENA543]